MNNKLPLGCSLYCKQNAEQSAHAENMIEAFGLLSKEWFANQQVQLTASRFLVFPQNLQPCSFQTAFFFFFVQQSYNSFVSANLSFIFALKINISLISFGRPQILLGNFFFFFNLIWINLQLEHQQLYCPQISGMFQAENWFYPVGDLKECALGFIK